jgi:broad specificity phosphatase PhoE
MSSKTFPSSGTKPKFNPDADYEAVADAPTPKSNKPAFNPNAHFEPVHEERTEPVAQPAFHVELSTPTFKSAPAQTGPNTFQYNAPAEAGDIIKLGGKARVAQENLHKELSTNKQALGRVIVNDRIKQQEKNRQAGIVGPQLTDPLFITDDDLNKVNTEATTNRDRANQVLSAAMQINPEKAQEIQKNAYMVDAFNNAAQDVNGNERVNKIEENAKAISKGELNYDHHNQILSKPEGFFGSLVSARNELNRLSDAYDYTKKMEDGGNEAGIIMELNNRIKRDPDEPVKMPTGLLGHLGANIGGMPIKGLAAGTVAGIGTSLLGNPEASEAAFNMASAGVNANDMYKIGYQNALEQNYALLKRDHPDMPDYTAFKQAQDLAGKQAVVDAASAAAMQYLGGKAGFGASKQLAKGISSGLSQVKDELGKKAFESLGVGAIGAGGQTIKNLMAQNAGLNVPTSEGAMDQFTTGLLMTGAMSMLGLGKDILKPFTKAKLASGIAKLPDNVVEQGLNKVEQAGHLTPEQLQNVKDIISEQKALENSIPETLPESDRQKIGDKIKERSQLKQQLEQVDEAYHPELKDKIKKLNEDILSISKGSERGELQQLVHGEINKGNVQGYLTDILRNANEKELEQYMKEISEQAHDPASEENTIKTFGEKIVNKAKELYPKKESAVSVIQPGEIKQPETITIAPRERPSDIKSTENVSVIMPNEAGAGKVVPDNIGHVEVSEHGEDTKTEAGQENGTQPSKLSEDGIKEAKELGNYLAENNKTKIITSEVQRAQETAHTAAAEVKNATGKEIPVETNPLLNTWNIGEYDGKPEGSFNEKEWIDKPNEAPKGGESFNDFKGRMEQAYQYVKSLPEDNHVVSHSKVMRALEALKQTDGKWTDETTKEFLNNKELPNAVPIQSTNGLDVRQQTGNGETMGEGNTQPEIITGTQGGSTEEKSNDQGEENKIENLTIDDAYGLPFIDEPGDKRTGVKNKISDQIRFERKLPEVPIIKMGSDVEKLQLGKELVDSGKINPLDIVNRVLNAPEGEHGVQPNEVLALQYYMHQLNKHETNLREQKARAETPIEEAEINGQLQQLSDEIDAATRANKISGNAWHYVGDFRQIEVDTGYNPHRDVDLIRDAYGGEIPSEVKARLDKVLKERDDALNKLAKLQIEQTKQAADETIKKESPPKNPKKSATDFKNERTEIKKSISDKLKKGRTGESGLTAVPLPFAKELISITPEIFQLIKSYAEEGVQKTEEIINRLHEVLKDELDGIQKSDIVNLLAGKYKAQGEEVDPIAQRIRDYRTEANIWTKIAAALKMEEDTPKKKEEKNKKLQDLRDRLNDIRKRNKEAVKEIQSILTPEMAKKELTDAEKELNRLEKLRKSTETKFANKKYLQPETKKSTALNTAIVKEKQRIANAQYNIRVEKRKAFESQKNFYQKALMWTGRAIRLSILSGYNVLGKLAAAATIGGAGKRIPEQAIGFIYGQAFRGIAEKAPIEGFTNAKAEAKFYKEFFNPKTFAKNAWQILKTGESPLSKQFSSGQYEHIPGLYLPTDLHQIIKDPLKRATYEASLKNAMVWAERQGLDINDDLVMQSLQTAAYKRAQYEIFQESNVLSRKFGEWKSNMEKKGNWGATGKFLADFMVPVSTVPTNIARRVVTTSPLGLIRGGVKVVEAYRKGIENLTPEEADSVMKQLKQGTLGTALWLIGWYGASYFGGLYSKFNPNKSRDQGELKSDEMSVGGKMIPKPIQHALPLEVIQFAATARHVYDHYSDKGASTAETIEKAGLASIGGLTEQIPILESAVHAIGATTDPYEAKKLEDDAKRRFEPQILKETGIIGKESGGSGGGAGATGTVSKPTREHRPTRTHKTHR